MLGFNPSRTSAIYWIVDKCTVSHTSVILTVAVLLLASNSAFQTSQTTQIPYNQNISRGGGGGFLLISRFLGLSAKNLALKYLDLLGSVYKSAKILFLATLFSKYLGYTVSILIIALSNMHCNLVFIVILALIVMHLSISCPTPGGGGGGGGETGDLTNRGV